MSTAPQRKPPIPIYVHNLLGSSEITEDYVDVEYLYISRDAFHSCGDVLLSVKLPSSRVFELKAPYDGYYSNIPLSKCINSDSLICYVCKEQKDLRYYGLTLEYSIPEDPFSEEKTIKWNSVFSWCGGGFNIGVTGTIGLNLWHNQPCVYFYIYEKAYSGDLIKMLFMSENPQQEDKKIIELPITVRPTRQEKKWSIRVLLSPVEIELFLNYNLVLFQIVSSEDRQPLTYKLLGALHPNKESIAKGQYCFRVYSKIYVDILEEIGINWHSFTRQSETEKTESDEACFVYLMVDTTNRFHKIGISNQPQYREHTLQSEKPTIELICAKQYPTRAIAEAIESSLHKTYGSKRIRGEWFALTEQDVADLKKALS